MLLITTLPLFLVVLILASTQYDDQRQQVLKNLEADSASYVISLESIAKQADDHVLQMKSWFENRPAVSSAEKNQLSLYFRQRLNQQKLNDGFSLDSLPNELHQRTGQVLWIDNKPLSDTEKNKLLNLTEQFFEQARLTHSVSPYFQWSYFFASNRQWISIFPWQKTQNMIELLGLPNLLEGGASYFEYEIFTAGTPDKNPKGNSYWTAPYLDAAGAGAMISHGAPVYVDNQFHGIVGTDLKLITLEQFIISLPKQVGRLLILDNNNHVLADSSGSPENSMRELKDVLPETLGVIDVENARTKPGKAQEQAAQFTIVHQAEHAPWTLVHLISQQEMNQLLIPRIIPYGVILAMLSGTFALALYLLRKEFITPALTLAHYIESISNNTAAEEPQLPRLWRASVETISHAFSHNREVNLKLEESEAFMSAIIENALLAVITMDESGYIIEFNPAAERVFGWGKAKVLGKDMADLLIPPRFRDAHRRGLERFLASNASQLLGKPLTLAALKSDGTEFPVEMSISMARLGNKRYFTAFMADLTERVKAEEQLARQRDALRQSEKLSAMGAMLAGVAHELNNPLAILMGRAALLEGKATDPAIREDSAKIKAAADRCGRIVKAFLSMARKKPVQRHAAKLNDVVQGALDLLGYSLRTAGISVRTELDRTIPEIEMDADQIGQIVVNFLVNAQQALADQTHSREIILTTQQEENALCLRVQDNGPGVASELRDRIFDPFFTTKPEGTGTGVGLSVSRAIAREHGGELVLEQTNTGACFLLRLPLTPGCISSRESTKLIGEEPAAGRVLVIDDEPEVASLLADILRSAGYLAHIANDGEAALNWLNDNSCDLIFCDMRMPGMDGPSFWRALNQQHPGLCKRLAFVTGDTFSASVEPFLKETEQPCLEKPFTPDDVLELAAKLEVG